MYGYAFLLNRNEFLELIIGCSNTVILIVTTVQKESILITKLPPSYQLLSLEVSFWPIFGVFWEYLVIY